MKGVSLPAGCLPQSPAAFHPTPSSFHPNPLPASPRAISQWVSGSLEPGNLLHCLSGPDYISQEALLQESRKGEAPWPLGLPR